MPGKRQGCVFCFPSTALPRDTHRPHSPSPEFLQGLLRQSLSFLAAFNDSHTLLQANSETKAELDWVKR